LPTDPVLVVHGGAWAIPDDLVEAHVHALERLSPESPSLTLNLGTGRGYSVNEVLTAVEQATGRKVPRRNAPRRPGDPPVLIADPTRAERVLRWKATRSLEEIVATAWNWMQRWNSGQAGRAR